MTWIISALTGFLAGVLGGLLGIGGGIIMIPSLLYLLKFTQHESQGTTLAAMVLPIGYLAAKQYYDRGHVNIPVAIIIAVTFFLGGFFGGKFAESISGPMLKKIFALLMLVLSLKMFFEK